VATDAVHPHPGRNLLEAALSGGTQISARRIGAIAPGLRCDLVELNPDHPALAGLAGDTLLDAWVFNGQGNPVRRVIVGGREVVSERQHIRRDDILTRFRTTMAGLRA
jgi:formimidoylglutamate deiminase